MPSQEQALPGSKRNVSLREMRPVGRIIGEASSSGSLGRAGRRSEAGNIMWPLEGVEGRILPVLARASCPIIHIFVYTLSDLAHSIGITSLNFILFESNKYNQIMIN